MVHSDQSTVTISDTPSEIKDEKSILPQWFVQFFKPARMVWLGPLLGLLLALPSLFSGYLLDDHFLRQNNVAESVYLKRQPIDYFNFISSESDFNYYRERGILLSWWSGDQFRNRFFRPVASMVHAFEFKYFDNAPWVMHAGLITLWVLLVIVVSLLLKRFCSSPAALGAAIVLFVINDTHAFTIGWISSYNTLLCCVSGMVAFLMFDKWCIKGSIKALLLFIGGFINALLCSEGALALCGYLFAYVLFIHKGNLRQKTLKLVPPVLIAGSYVVFYFAFQFGVKYSGVYFSPADLFTSNGIMIPVKAGALLFSQLLSFPPICMALVPMGATGMIIEVVLLAVLLFLFRKSLFNSPHSSFFFTAMVFSILPFALGPVQDRLLLWSGMGAAGFLAELFSEKQEKKGTVRSITMKSLLFTNTFVSLFLFIPSLFTMVLLEKPSKIAAETITPNPTVVLNTPWDISLWYPPAIGAEMGRKWPDHLYPLYSGADTVSIKRTGERTIEATVARGWFTTPEMERFSRSSRQPFKQGDRVKLDMMSAEIVDATCDGRPLKVRFEFTDALESFTWMQWTKERPVKREVPKMGIEEKLFSRPF